MKKILFIAIIVIQATLLLAVFDDYQPSARARGFGNAFTSVSNDANAIFYNPAGLSEVKGEAIIGFSNLYNQQFSEFKTAAAALALPQNLGTLAIGAKMFDVNFEDTNLMSEQVWSIAHGFTLLEDIHSTINFGYTGNFYRLSFDEMGEGDAFGLDVGALAILHQRTRFGFSVTNINHPKMGDENQHSLPQKLAMGIAYTPYDGVTTSVEMKKDFAQETEFMGGVEARIFEPLAIRVGVHQNPATWNAGASFYIAGLSLDYSFTEHAVLPATHYLNLGYRFLGR